MTLQQSDQRQFTGWHMWLVAIAFSMSQLFFNGYLV